MAARLRFNVVDALEKNQVPYAAAIEHIPVEARHRVRTLPIEQQSVTADARVDYAQHAGFAHCRILRQTYRKIVGPAAVRIQRGMVAVGDRVA